MTNKRISSTSLASRLPKWATFRYAKDGEENTILTRDRADDFAGLLAGNIVHRALEPLEQGARHEFRQAFVDLARRRVSARYWPGMTVGLVRGMVAAWAALWLWKTLASETFQLPGSSFTSGSAK